MAAPDGNGAVDMVVSRIYETNDASHPVQRVLFGCTMRSGVPVPVVERRDANTGELIQSYFGEGATLPDLRADLDSIGTCYVSATEPEDDRCQIWIDTSE